MPTGRSLNSAWALTALARPSPYCFCRHNFGVCVQKWFRFNQFYRQKIAEANKVWLCLTFGDGWPSKDVAPSARPLFASNFLFVAIRFFGVGVRNCEEQHVNTDYVLPFKVVAINAYPIYLSQANFWFLYIASVRHVSNVTICTQ